MIKANPDPEKSFAFKTAAIEMILTLYHINKFKDILITLAENISMKKDAELIQIYSLE